MYSGLGQLGAAAATAGNAGPVNPATSSAMPPVAPGGSAAAAAAAGLAPGGGGGNELSFAAVNQQFPREVEDEANSYFQRIYTQPDSNAGAPPISIDEVETDTVFLFALYPYNALL